MAMVGIKYRMADYIGDIVDHSTTYMNNRVKLYIILA